MDKMDLIVEIFGDALDHLLQEKEGIVIEHEDDWYLIHKDEGHIRLNDVTDLETFEEYNKINGQRMWLHDDVDDLRIARKKLKETYH